MSSDSITMRTLSSTDSLAKPLINSWPSKAKSVLKKGWPFLMTAVFVVVVIVLLARIHNLDDKVESMISLAYEAATASQQKSDLAINLKDNNDDDPELDHDVAEVHKKLADLHSLVTSSSIVPWSCREYFKAGIKRSDEYMIDPDGPGQGVAPFKVYCDFEKGATVIHHDHEGKVEIERCPGKKCFSVDFNYKASPDQIKALIESSETCSQSFRFDCYLSKLSMIGSWTDSQRKDQAYFSGANSDGFCKCHHENQDGPTCFRADLGNDKCNCDIGDPVSRFDDGMITNKTSLPVMSFNYGNMYLENQKASIMIGPLECKETIADENSESKQTCETLRKKGMPSGFYLLDVDFLDLPLPPVVKETRIVIAFCTMHSSGAKTHKLGVLHVKEQMRWKLQITEEITVNKGDILPFVNVEKESNGYFDNDKHCFLPPCHESEFGFYPSDHFLPPDDTTVWIRLEAENMGHADLKRPNYAQGLWATAVRLEVFRPFRGVAKYIGSKSTTFKCSVENPCTLIIHGIQQ